MRTCFDASSYMFFLNAFYNMQHVFLLYIYICILRTICVAHSRFIIWWSVWCKHIPRGEYKWCLPDYGFIGWSTARLQSIGAPKQIELDLKVMFWKTTESNMAFVRPFQYGNFGVVANMSWRCEGFIHLPQACFPKKRILSYLQNNQRKHLKISEFGRCVFFFCDVATLAVASCWVLGSGCICFDCCLW